MVGHAPWLSDRKIGHMKLLASLRTIEHQARNHQRLITTPEAWVKMGHQEIKYGRDPRARHLDDYFHYCESRWKPMISRQDWPVAWQRLHL